MAKLALVFLASVFFLGEAKFLAASKNRIPITEKVTIDGVLSEGSDLKMNECFVFTDRIKPVVEVCGTQTKVTLFLRGRCEEYYHYNEQVGGCDSKLGSDHCQTFDGTASHWAQASQSYMIEPCGTTR